MFHFYDRPYYSPWSFLTLQHRLMDNFLAPALREEEDASQRMDTDEKPPAPAEGQENAVATREEPRRLPLSLSMAPLEVFRGKGSFPMDVVEREDGLYVTAELPGFKKEEVQVNLDRNILRISAEKRDEQEASGETWHRRERRFGRMERSVRLSQRVDMEAPVETSFVDGVVSLKFALRNPAESVRQIAL